MSSNVIVRFARQEDVPEILGMIRELALFEKCPERCLATEETLTKTLTWEPSEGASSAPTPGYAKTFLATIPASASASGKEEVAGMGMYFYNYSTWLAAPGVYLEDLYVREQYRRMGVASMLLKRLAQEASDVSGGIGRLEWNCLRWNENALKFYERIGGERQEEWIGIRVEGAKLRKLAEGGAL